ncbi:hypothetical protein [Sedimenticola selenatireducens]|uniref:hypothetical protein n=1 Tax=Sedimenticola selenatireducens TaxID=191960 RepID=UPI0012F7D407|nr:hypothetical protein [Sedimenticola selenatireducens]
MRISEATRLEQSLTTTTPERFELTGVGARRTGPGGADARQAGGERGGLRPGTPIVTELAFQGAGRSKLRRHNQMPPIPAPPLGRLFEWPRAAWATAEKHPARACSWRA